MLSDIPILEQVFDEIDPILLKKLEPYIDMIYFTRGDIMKNKKFIIGILLIIWSVFFITDFSLAKLNKSPIFAIPVVIYKDGGSAEYYGLGYKVIKYVNLTVERGVEVIKVDFGTWFMDYNNDLEEQNSPSVSQIKNSKEKEIETAVSVAIKAKSAAYLEGEVSTEGHVILDIKEKGKIVKVYTIASCGNFGFENNIFTKISGSGAIPTLMIFSKNENGQYSLIEYKEPEDGSGYTDSIEKMFPSRLQDEVQSTSKYDSDLSKQQKLQATEYLKNIGKTPKVSEAYVEKKLIDINVEASNKLFTELTKYNSFLNNCPYWIGTREKIENGSRYIYETSQSKTSDGYDLIIFKKVKEDGIVVENYKYKIVGNEPKLID